MNHSVFIEPRSVRYPRDLLDMNLITMDRLLKGGEDACRLPLNVHVKDESMNHHDYVYHIVISNATKEDDAWDVYRTFTDLENFQKDIIEHATCKDRACSGSCEAIRDYLSTCLPKKRLLRFASRHKEESRKQRFESMLQHLLRCYLIPGSAMRCYVARKYLPTKIFHFLNVTNAQHQRSLLQIFVDNHQNNVFESVESLKQDSELNTVNGYDNSNCIVCMDTLCEKELSIQIPSEDSIVALPCGHIFHRGCIFEWLLFQFHCPLCRSRVGPKANKNYCCAKKSIQWWLGEFEEDPLEDNECPKEC